MTKSEAGRGGFFYPQIYKQSKDYVTKRFKEGEIDHADFSFWGFADKFFAYLLQCNFFKFVDQTYPSPRKKTEVPIWFLVSCQISMRMALKSSYSSLPSLLLNAGPILLRMGFNVSRDKLGFNNKNKKKRQTYIDHSTVLKFFKHTGYQEIRQWYNQDVQEWFSSQQYTDSKGVYILDQTHCVVPDNKKYEDAVKMPVDEHGQLYKNLKDLTPEQRKAIKYHPCYALSLLMNLSTSNNSFHIAGYDWGSGNTDELPQAKKIIENFFKVYPRKKMKLLIVDRGYLDGSFITELKKDYGVDVLIPLKKSMSQYEDAIALSKLDDVEWEEFFDYDNDNVQIVARYKSCMIKKISLWDKCQVPLNTIVVIKEKLNENGEVYKSKQWILATTKKYKKSSLAVLDYKLRFLIEERNRQLKNFWNIAKFPSPQKSLIEAQISFVLLAYSQLQSYMHNKKLEKYAHKTISKLKEEESLGLNNVVAYVDGRYAIYDMKEAFNIINNLKTEEARQRLQKWINS